MSDFNEALKHHKLKLSHISHKEKEKVKSDALDQKVRKVRPKKGR